VKIGYAVSAVLKSGDHYTMSLVSGFLTGLFDRLNLVGMIGKKFPE
jgi:hypothetical protein